MEPFAILPLVNIAHFRKVNTALMSQFCASSVSQFFGSEGGWQAQQTSAFCSLLGRPCHLFPLLSTRQMGTHYPIWLLGR
jgi:hypothetical protein